MSLHQIVAALGGDLYAGGSRANVPAPGHSPGDRSVSLFLTGGRVVIHGFGGTDWRAARDWLREQGFIDAGGRLTGTGQGVDAPAEPDRMQRRETASRLWEGGRALDTDVLAGRYLALRAVRDVSHPLNLRHHPCAPTSVYRPRGHARPALMARISDAADRLTAVELTYLDPNGRRAAGLRLSRKTVGTVPAGTAVRLAPSAPEMLVAEGVVTTLAAMDHFGLPGWALGSANNLAAWAPPEGVRNVLIAADNGAVGTRLAARLRARLLRVGVSARVRAPDPRFGDWSEAAVAAGRKEEGR